MEGRRSVAHSKRHDSELVRTVSGLKGGAFSVFRNNQNLVETRPGSTSHSVDTFVDLRHRVNDFQRELVAACGSLYTCGDLRHVYSQIELQLRKRSVQARSNREQDTRPVAFSALCPRQGSCGKSEGSVGQHWGPGQCDGPWLVKEEDIWKILGEDILEPMKKA